MSSHWKGDKIRAFPSFLMIVLLSDALVNGAILDPRVGFSSLDSNKRLASGVLETDMELI